MVKGSTLAQLPTFRAYREIDDRGQIVEMCKNVFGGADYIPHVLKAYGEDPSCFPRVATIGSKVVAFCNLRILENDDDHQDVYLLEAVRVAESERGKGFGNFVVEETLRGFSKAVQPRNAYTHLDKQVRLLSVTVLSNLRMQKIFEKTGWTPCGVVHLWPSHSAVEGIKKSGIDFEGRLLEVLKVTEFIPEHALAAVTQWRQTTSPAEILQVLRQLRRAGASHLISGYYLPDTASRASRFLCSEYADVEKRSVWKLERADKPPALLLMQVETVQPFCHSPHGLLSACVVDLEGAECCVAFASSREELGCFQIAFDPAINNDVFTKSPSLSAVETSRYITYETKR